MKEQEDEKKRQTAVLHAVGAIEKTRTVDKMYEGSGYSKLTPKRN